jgi:hypothetical protein
MANTRALAANIQLKNDQILTLPIVVDDANGDVVPAPAGDVDTVVSNNPASLHAVLGATTVAFTLNNVSFPVGSPAAVINALVQVSPGLSFTITDTAGLVADVQGVDIVPDTTPTSINTNPANSTSVPQPVPTAPGP